MRWRRLVTTRLVPLLAAVLVVAGSTVFADRVVNPALLFLSGTVKIGIHGDLPGWSYPRYEPEGFDVALATFLADRYDFTLEMVPLQPQERETELRGGRVDLVIANYSIGGSSWEDRGRKRLDVMDFAGPYYLDVFGVMYAEDKLVSAPRREITVDNICVSNGTTAQDYLKGHGFVADQAECFGRFADPADPQVVGVVTDLSLLTTYTQEFGATVVPAVWRSDPGYFPVHEEKYGIAMADDSPALCRELTDAVDAFLTDENGWDRAFDDHLDGVPDRAWHKPERADTRLC